MSNCEPEPDHSIDLAVNLSDALHILRCSGEVPNAPATNALTVYYQPKVNAKTHRCCGFEALLRMAPGNGSSKVPDFLAPMEDAGFAPVIDKWVCNRVLRDLETFENSPARGLSIGINLHPDSLADEAFTRRLITNFRGRKVDFEVVERGLCDMPRVRPNILKMRQAGIVLSVDDFGSGFANFSMLESLSVDVVKLDKSLLDGADSARGRHLYGALVKLCVELGYRVVAEGVETREQVEMVQAFGVDQIQGWFFAKAMPLPEAIAFAALDRRGAALQSSDTVPKGMNNQN